METGTTKKILIKYVPVYDANLSLASGVTLTDEEITGGYAFRDELERKWQAAAPAIEKFYADIGFVLPGQTDAYVVHPRGTFTPFSDPLTVHITKDLDDAFATLVHEYCHVLFQHADNDAVAEPLWDLVQAAFSSEDFVTQDHLVVNTLAEAGLRSIWGDEKTNAVLAKERAMPGLEHAWELLDAAAPRPADPLVAIRELCANHAKPGK